jgi:hypothetical protein
MERTYEDEEMAKITKSLKGKELEEAQKRMAKQVQDRLSGMLSKTCSEENGGNIQNTLMEIVAACAAEFGLSEGDPLSESQHRALIDRMATVLAEATDGLPPAESIRHTRKYMAFVKRGIDR